MATNYDFFDRNGNLVSMETWAREFQSPHLFRKEDKIRGYLVVTQWRGTDAPNQKNTVVKYSSWTPNEIPQIFETFILDVDYELVFRTRYATIEAAYNGHAESVSRVRGGYYD